MDKLKGKVPVNIDGAKTGFSKLATDPSDRSSGSAKGMIKIANDFDAPIPDLERAFED